MLLLILGLVVLGVLAASYRHLWPFAPPTPIPIRPATPVAGAKAPITVTALPSPTATPEPDELALIINPVDQAIYVPVPAGEFAMGSPPGAGFDDEQPQRQVTLDRFWIGQTEVTNGMYGRCVAAGACTAPDNSRWNDPVYVEHPVVNVNWFQATAYAAWVGGRLPTEAEWEKAACGADARIFPWGNDAPDATHGNFMQETGDTAPVGSFAAGASPYQALDMAGNVWEWVNDWFGDPYAPDGPIANPAGPATGERRVLRGAAWGNDSDALRCTYRYGYFPDEGRQNYGFRVVLTPEAMPPATQPGEALAP